MKHLVKRGDTLSELAERYGVTVDDIMQANPKIRNRDLIYTGDIIEIPGNKVRSVWNKVLNRLLK